METRQNVTIELTAELNGKKWPVQYSAEMISDYITTGQITEGRGLGVTVTVVRYVTTKYGTGYGILLPEFHGGEQLQSFHGVPVACTADDIAGIIENKVDRQTVATVANYIVQLMAEEENRRTAALFGIEY